MFNPQKTISVTRWQFLCVYEPAKNREHVYQDGVRGYQIVKLMLQQAPYKLSFFIMKLDLLHDYFLLIKTIETDFVFVQSHCVFTDET